MNKQLRQQQEDHYANVLLRLIRIQALDEAIKASIILHCIQCKNILRG